MFKFDRKSITVMIFVMLSLLLMQCKGPSEQPSSAFSVTASFYPLYFFASQIGGEKAAVVNITPAGTEPHDFEPTPRDVALITRSRLLILNGGGLEAWGDRIRKNIDSAKTKIVVAGEGLTDGETTENGKQVTDPHIWLSPILAIKMVDRITRGFISVDPADSAYYFSNSDTLKRRLEQLDRAYRQGLSNCAARDIITSHEAFSYLASTYGLRQIGIAGISPNAEPSPRRLAEIAAYAKKNDIKYIFFESLVSPKLAETIATEVGAQTLVLNPIAGLTIREQARGENYFTIMQENLANLEKALRCEP
jgi:zinc transport system substrate-binding protein